MTDTPEHIRRDIEATREELSRDVDALSEKVSPARVLERRVDKAKGVAGGVKDKVMGAASATGDSVAGTAATCSRHSRIAHPAP